MIVCLVGAAATSFLPETLRARLPDSLEVKMSSDLPKSRLNEAFYRTQTSLGAWTNTFPSNHPDKETERVQTFQVIDLFFLRILQYDYKFLSPICVKHTFCCSHLFPFLIHYQYNQKSVQLHFIFVAFM